RFLHVSPPGGKAILALAIPTPNRAVAKSLFAVPFWERRESIPEEIRVGDLRPARAAAVGGDRRLGRRETDSGVREEARQGAGPEGTRGRRALARWARESRGGRGACQSPVGLGRLGPSSCCVSTLGHRQSRGGGKTRASENSQ